MMHRKYERPTADEKRRMDAMMRLGCIVSMARAKQGLSFPLKGRVECQHLIMPGKRFGHLYTIPLHEYYHRGIARYPHSSLSNDALREMWGAALTMGKKAFQADHGTEAELWRETQRLLGLSDELPKTKMLPRRLAPSRGI